MAIALPVLGLILLALFEFALLFFARGEVVRASRLAARKASLPGVTPAAVEMEIRRVLAPRLQRDMRVRMDVGHHTGDGVQIALSVPMNRAAPDFLWPIGFSLDGRFIDAAAFTTKE